MQYLNVAFEVVSPVGEEIFDESLSVEQQIEAIALHKAKVVFEKRPDNIVIGSDTIVYYEGQVLGKPKTEERAIEMLKSLSGKTHEVITSVAIVSSNQEIVFTSKTDVEFYDLSEEEINAYVKTKEPLDKAGAYTIQAGGSVFVKEIKGDFYTVMGLPIAKIYQTLKVHDW